MSVNHPVGQTVAASMVLAGVTTLPVWAGLLLAVPGAIYYSVLAIQTLPKVSLPPLVAWAWANKPYIVAALGAVTAGLGAYGLPVPPWLYIVYVALGGASLHSSFRQNR